MRSDENSPEMLFFYYFDLVFCFTKKNTHENKLFFANPGFIGVRSKVLKISNTAFYDYSNIYIIQIIQIIQIFIYKKIKILKFYK